MLDTLREIAVIQSTEASNVIENIHAPRARIESLVADKTTPQNRSEQEIAGYGRYEALQRSSAGWHEGAHDAGPWTEYLLGVIVAAYGQLEHRVSLVQGRGAKTALIKGFVRSSLSDEFTVAQVREAAPGVSDAQISKVLAALKGDGVIAPVGRGRGARWRRLAREFE